MREAHSGDRLLFTGRAKMSKVDSLALVLPLLLSKESDSNWEEKDAATFQVAALFQKHSPALLQKWMRTYGTQLMGGLLKMSASLRTQLAIHALGAISAIVSAYSEGFEQHIDSTVQSLFRLTGLSKKLVANAASDCLKLVVHKTQSRRLWPLFLQALSDKNIALRVRAAECVKDAMLECSVEGKKATEELEQCISRMLRDPNAQVRSLASVCLEMYSLKRPENIQRFIEALDLDTRTALFRQAERAPGTGLKSSLLYTQETPTFCNFSPACKRLSGSFLQQSSEYSYSPAVGQTSEQPPRCGTEDPFQLFGRPFLQAITDPQIGWTGETLQRCLLRLAVPPSTESDLETERVLSLQLLLSGCQADLVAGCSNEIWKAIFGVFATATPELLDSELFIPLDTLAATISERLSFSKLSDIFKSLVLEGRTDVAYCRYVFKILTLSLGHQSSEAVQPEVMCLLDFLFVALSSADRETKLSATQFFIQICKVYGTRDFLGHFLKRLSRVEKKFYELALSKEFD